MKILINFLFYFLLIIVSFGQKTEKIELSKQEKEYLKKLGTIKICIDPDWIPFEHIDNKGNYTGIAADLFSLITKRLNIKFEVIRTKNWNETLEFAKQGKCHLIPFMNQTKEREKYLIFTELFFTSANVLITREEHPFITDLKNLEKKTVVLPFGTSVEEKLRRDYPNLKIILVESELVAYKMVSEKKADMTLRALLMSAYTIRKEGLFNLKIAGEIPEYKNYLKIGVQKNEIMLRNILNKGIASITTIDRENIINKHINIKVERPFNYFILIEIFVGILLIIALILFWNYRLKKVNKEKTFLLNNIPIQIWYLKDSDTYGIVNQKHAEFWGKTVSQLSNKKIKDILPVLSAEQIVQNNRDVFENATKSEAEINLIDAKGNIHYLFVTKTPIKDMKGKIKYVVCTADDITEEKKAIINSLNNEKKLKAIFETANIGISITDRDGKYLMLNKYLENYLGMTSDVIKTKTNLDITHPEDIEISRNYFNEVLEKRIDSYRIEKRFIKNDGSIIWGDLSVSSVKNEQGDVELMVGMILDINTQKKINEELKKITDELNSYFINALDLFCIADLDGNFIKLNNEWENALGYKTESLIGQKFFDFIHPEDIPATIETVNELSQNKPIINFINRYKKSDNTYRFIEWRARSSGNLIYAAARDITDRKIMEDRLLRNKNIFESLVHIFQYKTETIQEFLDFSLNEIIRLTESRIGYIYYYNEEKEEFILNSWSKNVMQECKVTNPQTVYCLEKTGIWGEAVRQRKPILLNDFNASHPLKKGYPEGHVNIDKFLTIPVFHKDTIVAVVGVGNKESDYNEEDIIQLQIIMDNVWKTTEHRKAEEALAKERQRLDDIIKGTNAGTWEWNIKTGETIFNENWANIIGYQLKELMPVSIETWMKYAHPDDVKKSGELLEKHFRKETEYYECESRMLHKNGEWVWILDRGKVYAWDIDGTPLLMSGAHINIDKIKKTELALKESEERYRLLIETAQESIIIIKKMKIIYHNPAFLELVGYHSYEIEKLNFIDFVLDDDKNMVMNNYKKRIAGEEVNDKYQFRVVNKHNKIKWISISGTKLFWFGEEANMYFIYDINEQKLAELELKQLNKELSDSKNEIEVNLYQKNALIKELTEVKEKLEIINSTKDKFFSIIAHDLRSPFQGFIGLTELLIENQNDFNQDEIEFYIKEINQKAQNLFKLLKNLLSWAGMQRGTTPFEPQRIDIILLMQEVIYTLSDVADKKMIEIQLNYDEEMININIDENMIKSVFYNILSNAIKFTHRNGKVIISIKIDHIAHCVKISITDSGIGMSEELIQKLFRIDVKIGQEGTEGEESTGLGLLLSKEFIEKHNGTISIESQENIGSTFRILLPLEE